MLPTVSHRRWSAALPALCALSFLAFAPAQAQPGARRALPSQLLFVPTGSEAVDIYDLKNPNAHGPLAQITSGLVANQYQMTTDGAGDLFVVNTDFSNPNRDYVSVYAPPYTAAPTLLTGVLFPLGVAVDANGTVYVSNCGTYCSQTPQIAIFANGATTPTSTVSAAGFSSLGGLSLDAAGDLYIANSNRATGASNVFEMPAGSTQPAPLDLDGLFNIGGPGVGSVAVDPNGHLYVGNNSNSEYILDFRGAKSVASRLLDPFSFFDTPGLTAFGPDGNLYVPINCPNASCEGSVIAFKGSGKIAEIVGPPGPGISGVATWPNAVLPAGRPTTASASYARRALLGGSVPRPNVAGAYALPRFALPRFALPARTGTPAPGAITAAHPFHSARVAARHGGGWLSPAAEKGKGLFYVSESGNDSDDPGSVNIYSTQGQSQAPIGVLSYGMSAPQGIATDRTGNLYVTNSGNNSVTVFPPGQTTPSTTITNGIGVPYDVTVGNDGTVYVANVFGTASGYGSVTEYPSGSSNPSVTLTLSGENAVAVALDGHNNLFVTWYSLSSATVQVYEYAPGATSGTSLNLDLPAPSFPAYTLSFDNGGNLVIWYESYDHSVKYFAVFAPGATEPKLQIPGGSFLDIVSGIAFPRASNKMYLAALNVNESDLISYPRGIPLDVIGLNFATGIALSPGT